MWRKRVRSSSKVLNHGCLEYALTEVRAEISRSSEIHPAPQQAAEFVFHLDHPEETDAGPGFKLHEDVHVGPIRIEGLREDGPEQGQFPDLMMLTERLDAFSIEIDADIQGHHLLIIRQFTRPAPTIIHGPKWSPKPSSLELRPSMIIPER
jgi:hypothetical protein